MRRLLKYLPLFLILLLGSCSNEAVDAKGRKVITFAAWGNPKEVELVNECIAEFEASAPDVTVKFVHIPNNYDYVLLTMMAGGRAPDIFYIGPKMLTSMLSKNVLLDIQDYMENSQVLTFDFFFPQILKPYRWNGERYGEGPIYGLCKDWSSDYMIYYNKDLFDEAGLPYPDGTWTREEFVEVAQKLTKKDDRGRVTQFGVYNNAYFEQWVRQSGGRVFSEDFRQCTLDSPEALAGLQFAADLTNKWHVAPNIAEQAQSSVNVMFETGRVAMCFYGAWFVPQFKKNIKNFEWDVVEPPHDKVDILVTTGMNGFAISRTTPIPDETFRFLEYLVGPSGQGRQARAGWNIPSSKTVAYGPDYLHNPKHDGKILKTFLDATEKTVLIDINPYISREEFDLYFQPEWDLVMLGEKSVEEAMATVVKNVNQAIKDNIAILGDRHE